MFQCTTNKYNTRELQYKPILNSTAFEKENRYMRYLQFSHVIVIYFHDAITNENDEALCILAAESSGSAPD